MIANMPEDNDALPPPQRLELKDQMDYAMQHFSFIAEQRLKTFHFYAILAAASMGGTLTVASKATHPMTFGIIGVLQIAIAVVFYIVERRNLALLRIARNAVIHVESQAEWPLYLKPSCADETKREKRLNFSTAFRLAFALQAFVGAGLMVWTFLSWPA